jgi:hypothetical protein
MYPEDFHVRNLRGRLEQRGDPLKNYFASPQSLTALLESGRARRARPLA